MIEKVYFHRAGNQGSFKANEKPWLELQGHMVTLTSTKRQASF